MPLYINLFVALFLISFSVNSTVISKNLILKKTDFSVCFNPDGEFLKNHIERISFKHTTASKTYYEGVWPFRTKKKKSIKVPIEQEEISAFSNEEKLLIQETLEKANEDTGIHISGWEECRELDSADLIFVKSDLDSMTLGAVGHLGAIPGNDKKTLKTINSIRLNIRMIKSIEESYHKEIKTLVGNDTLNSQYTAEVVSEQFIRIFKNIIVHEFGHFLGLQHEFVRLEKDGDQRSLYNTLLLSRDENKMAILGVASWASFIDRREDGLTFLGDYDYFSVMDYIDRWNTPIILSLRVFCLNSNDEVCDTEMIDHFLRKFKDKKSDTFFSSKDIATIRNAYLSEPFPLDEERNFLKNDRYLEWFEKVNNWLEKRGYYK